MRISDWSSDVCSSDLTTCGERDLARQNRNSGDVRALCSFRSTESSINSAGQKTASVRRRRVQNAAATSLAKASARWLMPCFLSGDRTRVVLGMSVSVHVGLGGRRVINKKQKKI